MDPNVTIPVAGHRKANEEQSAKSVTGQPRRLWKRAVLIACLGIVLAVPLRHWLAKNSTGTFDAFTYWFGPRVLSIGQNPYVLKNLRDELDIAREEALVRHVPEDINNELHSYLAPPIDLVLYLPFSWISDYNTFLAVHWVTYFLAMMAALWFWVSTFVRSTSLRLLGALGGLALLFFASPVFRWSLGVGQIDYLYFLPLSGFAYLYWQSQQTGDRAKAIWSGALLAAAGFIKIFPGFILIPLAAAYLVTLYRRPANQNMAARRHLQWVLLGAVSISALLVITTLIFPGYQSYLNWMHIVRSNFVHVDNSHNLAHFVVVILGDNAIGQGVFLIVYLAFLGIVGAYLFFGKESISALHIAGLIALLPTFCWFWQDYYNVVLLLPALMTISAVWGMHGPVRQKVVRTAIVAMAVIATQLISGMGRPYPFLQFRLPAVLANPLPEMQMEFWPQFFVYPASVMLWLFIWHLQRQSTTVTVIQARPEA